jgi:FkbM family methyltransferase
MCNSKSEGTIGSLRLLSSTFARRALSQHANANIAPSHYVAVRQNLPRTRVIFHGVEDPFAGKGTLPKRTINAKGFAYLGRLVVEKGVSVLLEATHLLLAEGREVHVALIGDGPDRPRLEKEINALGLERAVRITGFLSGVNLDDILGVIGTIVIPTTMEETAVVYDVPGVPIRAGDVVLDIGANQGFFTCYAAFKGARVLAFEPVPELCRRLRENVDRNGFTDRVTIQQCAIGASPGFVNLFVSSYLGGAQSTTVPEFVRGAGVPVIQETLVECKTLSQVFEEFSLQRVRLCKLDVEGAELAILKTLSAADLTRTQSFALEYHEEAYDLRSLLRLVLDWGTHHVSFIEERPYIGNIMRLAASSALLTS